MYCVRCCEDKQIRKYFWIIHFICQIWHLATFLKNENCNKKTPILNILEKEVQESDLVYFHKNEFIWSPSSSTIFIRNRAESHYAPRSSLVNFLRRIKQSVDTGTQHKHGATMSEQICKPDPITMSSAHLTTNSSNSAVGSLFADRFMSRVSGNRSNCSYTLNQFEKIDSALRWADFCQYFGTALATGKSTESYFKALRIWLCISTVW